MRCLFLYVIPRRSKKRQIVVRPKRAPCASTSFVRSSSSVTSGAAATSARMKSACASMRFDLRSPPCLAGARLPEASRRRHQRITLAALTPKRAAACRRDKPPSTTATARSRRSTDNGWAMHAGLPSPARSLNQTRTDSGIPQRFLSMGKGSSGQCWVPSHLFIISATTSVMTRCAGSPARLLAFFSRLSAGRRTCW